MIRLDDDDILDSECLEFVSKVFTETPKLDFAYGSSALFKDDELFEIMKVHNKIQTLVIHRLPWLALPYQIFTNKSK